MKRTLSYIALALFALLWAAPFALAQSAPPTSGTAATVTAVDTTNGLSLSNGTVSLAAAGASANGAVTTGAQTFGGAKTMTAGTITGGSWVTAGGGSGVITMTGDSAVNITRGSAVLSANNVEASIYWGTGTGNQGYVGANATTLVLNASVVTHNFGVRLNTAGGGSKPACAVGIRGTLWYVQGAGGVADTIEICGKSAADAYAWLALATFP